MELRIWGVDRTREEVQDLKTRPLNVIFQTKKGFEIEIKEKDKNKNESIGSSD
jgi:hypothetical protein